jgi:hypothetical protein
MVRSNALTQTRTRALLSSSALLLALCLPHAAQAQVEIDDDRTAPVRTSTSGDDGGPADVTVTSTGSITLTDEGPALILDSDNALVLDGDILIEDVDNSTGVDLQGGADRSFTSSGTISVSESGVDENTDDDPFADNPFADGTGRTGILVSGASPFEGNITLETASAILVEGNQSYGINLANTPVGTGLDGDLTQGGAITLRGDEGAAIRIGSEVSGNVINDGSISVRGASSNAFDISSDIGGSLRNTGIISSSGFRFTTRPSFNPDATFDILDLDAEDLSNAGSSIEVNADIARGIELGQRFVSSTDDEGNVTETLVSTSNVSQQGSAPAILIDGNGTPISIGTVSAITDPTADDFDADLLYAFVQQGALVASGVFDDFDATALSVTDATLDGGIRNSGTMSATTFVGSEVRPIDGVDLGTGLARVIVLGDNAIADAINNDGLIIAQATEDADQVYFDSDNIPAPRTLTATAIDIGANAQVSSLVNEGTISAVLIGREGTATVIQDQSGTLTDIVNRGNINALASTNDPNEEQATNFSLVALDLSANTSGVTFLQEARADDDPDDDVEPADPFITGTVRLGSGDDSFTATAGGIIGGIDFGAGNDSLTLNDTEFAGTLTNSGGLDISVENNGVLSVVGSTPVDITSASFDETSTFRPSLDGATGQASTLQATGAISFAAGATVNPILNNLINAGSGFSSTDFTVASASNLTIGDLSALNAADDGSFLFDTVYSQVGETLVVTVDLRDAEALGLDVTQTGIASSVYNATLQALQSNSELGNEIANLGTASEFYGAYNQLLPEFAAASRQFVVANVDGAVGAVANHLDTTRRSPDKPGGAWLQEFAYFADRDLAGLSEQYRGEGFGFAGGLDTALGPFHAVGVSLGYASTEIEDVVGLDAPLEMSTILAGVYAGLQQGALSIDGFVGGGLNEFEQSRRIAVGDYRGDSFAQWDGTYINANLRAGYDIALTERFWARPIVSLDYLRLNEDAYTESGDLGVALSVDSRSSEVGAVTGLLNFGANFEGRRTWIRPSIRVGYRNEFLSDPVLTSFRFSDIPGAFAAETLSADFPTSGVLVGFSIAAGSGFSSVGFDFDSDIRDGFVRHTGRIVVRLLF